MEGDLLDELLDCIDTMAEERSHTGALRTTANELAARLGRDDVLRVMEALHGLKKRGAFLQIVPSGTGEGRVEIITRRNPEGTDARGMLLTVLTQRANEISEVRGTFGEIQQWLSALSLSDVDAKLLLRHLELEGAVEDRLRMGGVGPTLQFWVRLP